MLFVSQERYFDTERIPENRQSIDCDIIPPILYAAYMVIGDAGHLSKLAQRKASSLTVGSEQGPDILTGSLFDKLPVICCDFSPHILKNRRSHHPM